MEDENRQNVWQLDSVLHPTEENERIRDLRDKPQSLNRRSRSYTRQKPNVISQHSRCEKM